MIGEGQPSVSFTHIEDDLTVPMPNKDELEAYVALYRLRSAERLPQQPKKPPPPKRRPKASG